MENKSRLEKLYFIGGIIVAVAALISLGWSLGTFSSKDRISFLEKENQSLREIQELNLENVVDSLVFANNMINRNLTDIRDYIDYKIKNDSLIKYVSKQNIILDSLKKVFKETISSKNKQIAESILKNENLSNRINSLQNKLSLIVSKTKAFELAEGEGDYLLNNIYPIGIKYISDDYIEFNINNELKKLEIGNSLKIDIDGKIGILTLRKTISGFEITNKCILDFIIP